MVDYEVAYPGITFLRDVALDIAHKRLLLVMEFDQATELENIVEHIKFSYQA